MTTSKVKAEVKQTAYPTWKKVIGGILLGLGLITFFLAQSTVWVSQNFFNEDQFVSTAKEVLSTEESRQAIASTIVDAAFQNNPVAQQLVGGKVTSLLSGLLGSDIASQVYDRVAHRAYAYLTSPDRQDIAIDLTSIKEPLVAIVGLVEKTGREVKFDGSNIPDAIVLVESDSLPDISMYIRIMLFASGALWLMTIIAFGAYIWLHRTNMVRSIYIVGWGIIAVSALALITGPFIPPAIASLVNLIGIRGLVEDFTQAFLEPFQVQLLSGVVVAALVLLGVSLRGSIRAGIVKVINLVKQ